MPEHLSKARRATLQAAVDRLMPPGDGPGALDAGADVYIEKLLRTRFSSKARTRVEEGLDQLCDVARELYGKDLCDCDTTEQDAVLTHAQEESGAATRRFFKILLTLTIEGFFCDPAHGGNRNLAGWRFIGFDPRQETPS